jgi:hypothetical protein
MNQQAAAGRDDRNETGLSRVNQNAFEQSRPSEPPAMSGDMSEAVERVQSQRERIDALGGYL